MLSILKSSKAAIDLASIMVGVVVMGLVGAVIAASVMAIIPWAQQKTYEAQMSNIYSALQVADATCGSTTVGMTAPAFCNGITGISSYPQLLATGLLPGPPSYDPETGQQLTIMVCEPSDTGSEVATRLSTEKYVIFFISTATGPKNLTVLGAGGKPFQIEDIEPLGLPGYGFISMGSPDSLGNQLCAGTAQDGYLFN